MVPYNQMTDHILVDRYMSGCNTAFDMLLMRYKDRLYHYILFAVKDAEIANDLFQETFVKVLTALRDGRYRETERFYAWLTRIAHNLIIDYFRQTNSYTLIREYEFGFETQTACQPEANYIEATWINQQTLQEIRDLVKRLPKCQQEVVFMRFYQNLSFKEIAHVTGVSINTALGRMRYALLNLRKIATDRGLSFEIL